MNIANSIFNVRIVSSEDIPASLLKPGQITILGSPEELHSYAHKAHLDILQRKGVDMTPTFYSYTLKITDDYERLATYLDCTIMAPLPSLTGGETEMVIASAVPEDFGFASATIINEIERRTRDSLDSAIALFALGAPEAYGRAVEKLLKKPDTKPDFSSASSLSRSLPGMSFGLLSNDFEEIAPDSPKTTANRVFPKLMHGDIVRPQRKKQEEGKEKEPAKKQDKAPGRKISDREIWDVYNRLPERYSALYEKENPAAAEVVRHSLDVIDKESLVALLVEAAKTDKKLLQKIQNAKRKMANKFRIKVKQWSSDLKNDFNGHYRFCLYLADGKGREKPIRFKHNPSYCIFMMYVVDRFTRGMDATSLSFADNKEEFKRLYRSVFYEDTDKIDSYCSDMAFRQTRPDGPIRKGRFDDYIKDINDTMDELVGTHDSISLKVGHGRFLDIPPHQIEIDPNLPFFNFA